MEYLALAAIIVVLYIASKYKPPETFHQLMRHVDNEYSLGRYGLQCDALVKHDEKLLDDYTRRHQAGTALQQHWQIIKHIEATEHLWGADGPLGNDPAYAAAYEADPLTQAALNIIINQK